MTTAARSRVVRHELRFRQLTAHDVERLTPNMVRVRFTGEELEGFASADAADHVKVFFPPPGATSISMPVAGPKGPAWLEEGGRPAARDYTPRHFDPATNTLTIDFFVHGRGPGSTWADNARPGDVLGIGGPRGSVVLEDAFDWYLLIGDETALPTIGRRLEELPAGTRTVVVVVLADDADRQDFTTPTNMDLHWVRAGEDPATAILDALRGIQVPNGEGYAWVSGEATMLRDVRRYLLADGGFDHSRLDVNGHWKRGTENFDHHEAIEE
ncbi:MAG TPA: siderophore-interacting protein [Thermomicrobiales bacterium]|jgi:NADPH-dependent ferric siderophore reductase|nr:siderophore-interacting protein [Thermomicrobiales bacterium]